MCSIACSSAVLIGRRIAGAMIYAIAGVAGPLPYVAAGRAATKAARK